jgi:sugar phosphate isomerase/epimerase
MPGAADADRMRELTRATGVGTTLHLSYVDLNLASLIPAARRRGRAHRARPRVRRGAVGASCGVLHTGQHYLRHPQVDPLVAGGARRSLRARGRRVPIALENLVLGRRRLLRTPEELRDLTDRHGMRNCLDFGHAHVQATREGTDALQAYLDTLGDDVIHLHLHGNHGARDEHLATDRGTLDYAPYAAYLRTSRHDLPRDRSRGGRRRRRARSVAHLRGSWRPRMTPRVRRSSRSRSASSASRLVEVAGPPAGSSPR